MESRGFRLIMKAMTMFAVVFLYAPLAIVVLYAFSKSRDSSWPPNLFTTSWFKVAWNDPDLKPALFTSIKAGIVATLIALALGSLAAFAVHRSRFFGRRDDLVRAGAADRAAGHRDGVARSRRS